MEEFEKLRKICETKRNHLSFIISPGVHVENKIKRRKYLYFRPALRKKIKANYYGEFKLIKRKNLIRLWNFFQVLNPI
jgi:hypothetical protein